MMPATTYTLGTPSSAEFSVLKACIMQVLNLDTNHVNQGRQNGVPSPTGQYVIMSGVNRPRLSTPSRSYNTAAQTEEIDTAFDSTIQVDCYSPSTASVPNAADMATMLNLFLNSPDAVDFFDAWTSTNLVATIEPLYATEPTTMAYTNEENQFEQRYTQRVHLNVTNKVTVTNSQTMASAMVTLVNVQTLPR